MVALLMLVLLASDSVRSEKTQINQQPESSSSQFPAEWIASPAHHEHRLPRGSKRERHPLSPHERRHPNLRGDDEPDRFFTTPRSLRVHEPLHLLAEGSARACVVLALSVAVLCAGVAGNLALMCIVWQNFYLTSTWNCVLASVAFCDFLLLVLCLPVKAFHELSGRTMMGELTCPLVPFMEVTSLGVNTFSLCALSIERFHAITSTAPPPRVEPCRSILPRLGVVWLGAVLLATPELMPCPPPPHWPDPLPALALTYQRARTWWRLGCFICLPLLFSAACHLLTRHLRGSGGASSSHGQQVAALAGVYAACTLPESVWGVALACMGVEVGRAAQVELELTGHALLFLRAAVTPFLLLRFCPTLSRACSACCCCCCQDTLDSAHSSLSASPVLHIITAEKKLEQMNISTPC